MNELTDRLIVRTIFALFICLVLVLYKYAHYFLYPSSRSQLFKKFYPSLNTANTIHLFSRILGIGIIFSNFHFYVREGLTVAIVKFLIQGSTASLLYLLSIYILESVSLYNFEFVEEVVKRKNVTYGTISFAQALALALIIKTILSVSQNSLILFFFLWLFALVVLGFASKAYQYYSTLPFNKLLYQKNISLAFSYSGYIFGCAIIINSALLQNLTNIQNYAIQVVLKIVLALIIFPIFKWALVTIFRLQVDILKKDIFAESKEQEEGQEIGHGIYEGAIFVTSSYLTGVIIGHIYFGINYPIF